MPETFLTTCRSAFIGGGQPHFFCNPHYCLSAGQCSGNRLWRGRVGSVAKNL